MLAGLTEEQEHIKSEARRRLEAERNDERLLALLEAGGAYDETLWSSAREMGWTAIAAPEAFGGLGLGLAECCLLAEELGRVCAGAPFLSSSLAVIDALAQFGGEAEKASWLEKLASGEAIGALAAAEGRGALLPERPGLIFSDNKASGEKTAVIAGAHADVAIVFGADPSGAARLGVIALDAPGVERRPVSTFDASRGVADLSFTDAPVALLQVNDARAAANRLIARLALVNAFEQIGGADRCMELARDFALERRAFGQPIGAFQSIKHCIAEMYVKNELARGNAIAAATSCIEDADDFELRAAAARISAIDAYEFASRETMQVHGGVGVTWEAGLHLHLRRARALALELGAKPEWEERIVSHLTTA